MSEHRADEDAIRRRAYELSQEDDSTSAEENWRRAEQELKSGGDSAGGGPWAKTSSGDKDEITES